MPAMQPGPPPGPQPNEAAVGRGGLGGMAAAGQLPAAGPANHAVSLPLVGDFHHLAPPKRLRSSMGACSVHAVVLAWLPSLVMADCFVAKPSHELREAFTAHIESGCVFADYDEDRYVPRHSSEHAHALPPDLASTGGVLHSLGTGDFTRGASLETVPNGGSHRAPPCMCQPQALSAHHYAAGSTVGGSTTGQVRDSEEHRSAA